MQPVAVNNLVDYSIVATTGNMRPAGGATAAATWRGHGGAQRAAGWLRSCTEASGEHYDDARSATIPNLQLRHDYSTAVPTVPL